MKKLFFLFLVAVIVCGLIPQNRAAEAQESEPSVQPALTCLNKQYRVGYDINNVRQIRHYQKIRWCFDGTKVYSNWKLTYGWNTYTSSWHYYGRYNPIIKGVSAWKSFQTSYLFYGYENDELYWLRSYIYQKVTRRGGYSVNTWHRFWAG